MQQFVRLARGLASPAILIVVVWCIALIGVAFGPIDYPMQPSPAVLALVAAGVSLFILAHWTGAWFFGIWFRQRPNWSAPSARILNRVVIISSLVGIGGIGLIALDRLVLSGVSASGYAGLLRCAPGLVDFIEIKRTPFLYLGYLTFSFCFASLVLLLLKGEEIRGWAAVLAQLSIVSPVGYALLYSGRMPILFGIVLIISAVLVRFGQGRRPLPHGHHLFIKMVLVVLAFAIYSNAIWASRQKFCVQMSGLIQEMQQRMTERDRQQDLALQSRKAEIKQELATRIERETQEKRPANNDEEKARPQEIGPQPPAASQLPPAASQLPPAASQQGPAPIPKPLPLPDTISAVDLSRMINDANLLPEATSADVATLLAVMREAWQTRPRAYVVSAIDSGRLSPATAMTFLSTYFYLTHGIRIIDTTWRAREQFSPRWGVYEIGVLSPALRVFFPQSRAVSDMGAQLRAAEIFGFFPTVWAAAYIDFGAVGWVAYILIWGFAAGWSATGARSSPFATPALLQVFVIASIFLSPVQGPLGIANSALVLLSMLVMGVIIDLVNLRIGSGQQSRELGAGALV